MKQPEIVHPAQKMFFLFLTLMTMKKNIKFHTTFHTMRQGKKIKLLN